MKTIIHKHLLAAALLLSTILYQPSTLYAQGSLTPPGAPAPTMKSLDQIEARTPVSSAPFTITNSGSYYLTTNLTVSSGNAITIATNGVTLDLNGFTIASTTASATGYGILLNSGSDLTIFNGHIRGGVTNNGSGVYSGSGFRYGIEYAGAAPVNTRLTRISVAGCLADGIDLGNGDSTVVESCTVQTVGGSGIVASTIKGSVALDCGGSAIYGYEVSDSRGESTGDYGLNANSAQNCYGIGTGNGYVGLNATTAQNCFGENSSSYGYGIDAYTALNCSGDGGSGGVGLDASTALNCFGYNSGSGYGIDATTAQNCYGSSSSGIGLYAATALNCRGSGFGSNPGLSATMANSCYGYSFSGTGLTATYGNFCFGSSVSVTTNYNMP